jgi:hypothetical protein
MLILNQLPRLKINMDAVMDDGVSIASAWSFFVEKTP